MGLIYEAGLRFEFMPPGAYKRNVLILHFMCYKHDYSHISSLTLHLNWEYTCTIDHGTGPRRQDQFVWFSSAAVIVGCDGSCMERKTTWKVN